MKPNKPDAVNPAMALWLTIEDLWRRVTDLERWHRFSPMVNWLGNPPPLCDVSDWSAPR